MRVSNDTSGLESLVGDKLARWRVLFIAFIVLGCALRIAFFMVSVSHLSPTSDEASNFLLAQNIADGARPLLFIGQPYQFPVEAYFYSLFVEVLPHNALGVRILPFILGLFTLAFLLFAACRIFQRKDRWPVVVLLLFPSCYLLCLQSAYAIPQYTFFLFSSALLLALAALSSPQSDKASAVLAAGLIGGLSFSSHMLILPMLIGVALVCCSASQRGDTLRRTLLFLVGLAVGLLPYVLAKFCIEGAYAPILEKQSAYVALDHFFNPLLTRMLPGALGFDPPVFPDYPLRLMQESWQNVLVSSLFMLLLVWATWDRAVAFIKRAKENHWISIHITDAPVVVVWASLILCAFNTRTTAISHRYALPVVLVFPFLVAVFAVDRGKLVRRIIMVMVSAWVLFNLGASMALLGRWHNKETIAQAADTPPLDHLFHYLQEKEITRTYAPFWLTYRLSYESNGRIVSSQLFNERFPSWPTPYKSVVDQSDTFALVLPAVTQKSALHNYWLMNNLNQHGFKYVIDKAGGADEFLVVHHVRHPATANEVQIPPCELECSASDNSVATRFLTDNDRRTSWSSLDRAYQGMWLQVALPGGGTVRRITLLYHSTVVNPAPSLTVQALHDNSWVPVGSRLSRTYDRQRVVNGRPVYGEVSQTIILDAMITNAIRIEIAEPVPGAVWQLQEIELYGLRESRQQ